MPERVFADKYEVQEQIAQGAMGIVYKALDRKLNRVVALKVVHPHLTSDASFLQRFLREARSMARLQHEHIVTIFSVEQDQGSQFMVMEYFQGTNLLNRIQPNRGLPLPEALSVTHQMAKALAYAHGHGIIHRDIKPANVLIGADNRIKLTDFGIAAALDEAPLTTAGQLIGTLLYMSPEQARDATLDGRSDLYSLGLMFYEMLTGAHPRRNLSNAAILGMLATEEKTPTVSFSSSIPTEVQTLVSDLLRYRPVDRIEDAHKLLHRLESLQAFSTPLPPSPRRPIAVANDQTICELGEPLLPSAAKSPTIQFENRRSIAPVLAISAVIVLAAVGLYAMFSSQSTPPSLLQTIPSPSNPNQPDLSPNVKPDGLSKSNDDAIAPPPKLVQNPDQTGLGQGTGAAGPNRNMAIEPIPAKPKVIVAPPSPSPLPVPVHKPILAKQDQRVLALLEQLRQSVSEKNFTVLDEISTMSDDRRNMLETLFSSYSQIDTSLGEIVTTQTGITTVLRIDNLILPSGEPDPPGPSLRKIRLTVPREGDTWGKIQW